MRFLQGFLIVLVTGGASHAQWQSCVNLDEVNAQLAGRILDYTHNHGEDNRIWSSILEMHRDLYVYVPPGFCDCDSTGTGYPLVLFFHGAGGDAHAFPDTSQIQHLDRLIRCGRCPPIIVACPDGACSGHNYFLAHHSLYVNSDKGGWFEDHVMQEVVPYLVRNFGVDPSCGKHAVIGASAGGLGAMTVGLKHHEFFGYIATLAGPINLRYSNVNGDYFEDFSPATYRWNREYRPFRAVGRFGCLSLVKLPAWFYITPVFGYGKGVINRIAMANPTDVLLRTDVGPGDLEMFIAYGTKDEFNVDAQAESFIWFACQKGIPITRYVEPGAGHSLAFFRTSKKAAWNWLGERLTAAQVSSATETSPERPEDMFLPSLPVETAIERPHNGAPPRGNCETDEFLKEADA